MQTTFQNEILKLKNKPHINKNILVRAAPVFLQVISYFIFILCVAPMAAASAPQGKFHLE